MISAGVEGRLLYMTYPEHYRGPSKQPPEFLRPAPKPLPSTRYNGLHQTTQNGTRLGLSTPRTPTKYSPPTVDAVNLTQHKEELENPYTVYARLFPPPQHPHFFPQNPYSSLYQSPYSPIARPNFVHAPPLSPLETFSPTTPTASTTFLPPPSTFSPPAAVKPIPSRDNKRNQPPQQQQQPPPPPPPPFKVPSGKEGSLKHRILTRPEDANPKALDLQRDHVRAKLAATSTSPPRSPKRTLNNNTILGNIAKGAIIRLVNGDLKRLEDMRTEDFVMSAESSPNLKMTDSTVVRIDEIPMMGTARITVTYNQRRSQVDFETALEYPFFVYGQGWASCNPERTFKCYNLKAHHLQVGDVIVTLIERDTPPPQRSQTIITTATTTAVTARQVSAIGGGNTAAAAATETAESMAARKRRWSAPEDICDEDEQQIQRRKH